MTKYLDANASAYLEYNSTINCSLMFSGIISRAGTFNILPVISELFQSNQSYFLLFDANALEITSKDLDFSRTPTTSETLTTYEGMFTTSPFTVICL